MWDVPMTIDQLVKLMLTDPETNALLVYASPIMDNGDGSFSFIVRNPVTGREWKHNIRTEEVKKEK